MRRISAMYEESGGTSASHKCGECLNFIERLSDNGKRKFFKCRLYSEACSEQSDWRKSYPACAWFNQDRKERRVIDLHSHDKPPEKQIDGQITLEDYMKELKIVDIV